MLKTGSFFMKSLYYSGGPGGKNYWPPQTKKARKSKNPATAVAGFFRIWRRRADSNRWIAVLQTAPLPLGYAALGFHIKQQAVSCQYKKSPFSPHSILEGESMSISGEPL